MHAKNKQSGKGVLPALILILIAVWGVSSIFEINDEQREQTREQAKQERNTAYFEKNKSTIITDVNKKIKSGQYKNALIQIDAYKHTRDRDLLLLKPIVEEKNLLAIVKTIPASKIYDNLKYYKQLKNIRPGNKKYKAKIAHYQQKVDIETKKRNARIATFGKQPTLIWGGGYSEVDIHLKRAAHDPESIDIDKCSDVYNNKSGWLVRCTYRGKNAFGALIRNTQWFTIIHGQVINQEAANKYKL